ncbi:MAG TPA: MTAP family purine nucleoside phosphorylase, partial [Tepidisphaeraceae bacterium]|nr:MTAP family purine nucleoside phosphorylase [Tepidisphaeraceae bacterium]
LAAALLAGADGRCHDVDTPFGPPADSIVETRWFDLPVCILSRHGKGHRFNPTQVPYRANIMALKQLGCTHILASGTVGSLREEFRPKHLVLPDQIIDRTTRRPGTFFEKCAMHVEFAEPFCPILRQILREAGTVLAAGARTEQDAEALAVHARGCYVAMEGPAFSTRAESLMHRLMGGDLIGMTAMPEAKLAREAELPYALVALVTDYDCWRTAPVAPNPGAAVPEATTRPHDPHGLLKEILANLESATQRGIALLKRAVEMIASNPQRVRECPARNALELALWSSREAIDPAEIERLAPLWGRHFSNAS